MVKAISTVNRERLHSPLTKLAAEPSSERKLVAGECVQIWQPASFLDKVNALLEARLPVIFVGIPVERGRDVEANPLVRAKGIVESALVARPFGEASFSGR